MTRKATRRQVANETKRDAILEAAGKVFAEVGLEGASLRAVAAEAGYTPAALYFHFDSKETLYSELLLRSLVSLREDVVLATGGKTGADKMRSAATAFFDFYAARPRELDLGFYLFRGGMKPTGLGSDRDGSLNFALETALRPIGQAAEELGASPEIANQLIVDIFAHATGLLLLLHTGRIKMFDASAAQMMEQHIALKLTTLGEQR